MPISLVEHNRLKQQISNPDFCYVRVGQTLFCHRPGMEDKEEYPHLKVMEKKPIRFTRLAAQRLCQRIVGAKIEEIPEVDAKWFESLPTTFGHKIPQWDNSQKRA